MSEETKPEVRFGVILDDGNCCGNCLKQPEEKDFPYSKPWLYVGEHYGCSRCKRRFIMSS